MAKRTILAGWLIDGTGAPAEERMCITVKGARIVSIERTVPEMSIEKDTILDLSDCTLLPTLSDCHVHMNLSGSLDPASRTRGASNEYQAAEQLISSHVRDCIRHGVLSARDGGDRHGYVLRYTKGEAGRNRIPFGLNTSGPAWHRKGRYGKFIGRAVSEGEDPIPHMKPWIEDGIDHIKVLQSGINSLRAFARETEPQFEKDAISRIFQLCRSREIGMMVHANGEKPVGIAIDGGCDSIEHGYFMGEENLRKMGDAGIVWVPTAVAMKAYADHLPVESIEAQVARKTLDHQLEQLSFARRCGVRVALGTDAGSPGVHHGKAVGEELGLLVSAGYSIEEAIECATKNAAVLMKNDTTGCLRAGDQASFVAVKGEPSQIPELLSEIGAIMVSGNIEKTDHTQSR